MVAAEPQGMYLAVAVVDLDMVVMDHITGFGVPEAAALVY
jgi:hypothetical protein